MTGTGPGTGTPPLRLVVVGEFTLHPERAARMSGAVRWDDRSAGHGIPLTYVGSSTHPYPGAFTAWDAGRQGGGLACDAREVRSAPHPRSLDALAHTARMSGSVAGVPAAEPVQVLQALR